ncbi:amidohydrolase family protein [Metasolibacillus sp. FSL K6-0083]|uniref:amidohydrolase family protein n=1 Tax=Metasolibacillus sp. FSL K6-0083 TaxID=2921416 RepID=UPI003159E99E
MKIDTHQHFWNFQRVPYKWPTSAEKEIYRNIEPDELAQILPTVNVNKTIIVQAFDSFEDTDYMLEIAKQYDWVAGVVGWLPLRDETALREAIKKYKANSYFKGMRHLIHNERDSTWLTHPATMNGLQILANENIPFDVVAVEPIHLEQALIVSERIPNLKMVINHLAKPKIAEKVFEPWESQMKELAKNSNIYAKISGLNTAASYDWKADDFQPYIDRVINMFGSNRLMFGSDWPVLNLAGTYKQVVDATERCLNHYTKEQQEDIWYKSAIEFYRLEGVY